MWLARLDWHSIAECSVGKYAACVPQRAQVNLPVPEEPNASGTGQNCFIERNYSGTTSQQRPSLTPLELYMLEDGGQ